MTDEEGVVCQIVIEEIEGCIYFREGRCGF